MSFFAFRRTFTLPAFDLVPLDFEQDADLLLLDDIVASLGALPDPATPLAAAPTAGELHQSIDSHLRSVEAAPAPDDAVGELRDALAQLRRSTG